MHFHPLMALMKSKRAGEQIPKNHFRAPSTLILNIPSSPSPCPLPNLHLQDLTCRQPFAPLSNILKHAQTISPSHTQPCALSFSHTRISEHWLCLSAASYTQKHRENAGTHSHTPQRTLFCAVPGCVQCVSWVRARWRPRPSVGFITKSFLFNTSRFLSSRNLTLTVILYLKITIWTAKFTLFRCCYITLLLSDGEFSDSNRNSSLKGLMT